jgi:hypothetical protein
MFISVSKTPAKKETTDKFLAFWLFLTVINDPGGKMYGVDTGDKLFTGVNDTGDKLY